MLAGLIIPDAKKIPVLVKGIWSPSPKRDWRGIASSSEPIVGITFLRFNTVVEWCLSERVIGSEIEVRLALFEYDREHLEVQVNASIGRGGTRYRSTVSSADYLPDIPVTRIFDTGKVVLISTVEGDPTVSFLGLFLARADAKSFPKGIWHVREHFRGNLPGVLIKPLTYGRTGRFSDP